MTCELHMIGKVRFFGPTGIRLFRNWKLNFISWLKPTSICHQSAINLPSSFLCSLEALISEYHRHACKQYYSCPSSSLSFSSPFSHARALFSLAHSFSSRLRNGGGVRPCILHKSLGVSWMWYSQFRSPLASICGASNCMGRIIQ